MKKLLIATSALIAAAPALANVTLSGTIDLDFTTGEFESGDGDVNTLSLGLAYTGEGFGGSLTLSPLNDGTTAVSSIVAGYNIYSNTDLGKFSIGTSDGLSTDDDLAETAQAVDFTLGKDDLTDTYGGFALTDPACLGVAGGGGSADCSGDTWDTGDGPVDNGALGVANSISTPSLSYTAPSVSGFTVGITWGSNQGASADYVMNIGYSNDMIDLAIDMDEDGAYVATSTVSTAVGNVLVELDDQSNYELRFETDLAQADLIPLSFAVYTNSEETVAFGAVYDLGVARVGFETTQFGDNVDNMSSDSAALNVASIAGGAPAPVTPIAQTLGFGVGFDAGSVPIVVTYSSYEEVDGSEGDSVKLEATMNDYVTVGYDTNSEQLNVGVSTSF